MEDATLSRANAQHSARLDKTLQDLQQLLRSQEAALSKLRAASTTQPIPATNENSTAYLHQLQALRSAHETLTPQAPYLPPPDSALPALLALRTTHATILSSRECLEAAKAEHAIVAQEVERERRELRDARLIEEAMGLRITALEEAISSKSLRTAEEVGRDLVAGLERERKRYEEGVREVGEKFGTFVDEVLAGMLAAEELGGPVVGDLLEVDELVLEAGFSAQGKARRKKAGTEAEEVVGGMRQRKIDEIWGKKPAALDEDEEWDERAAAGNEMRELVQALMGKLVKAGDKGGDGYVELARESAASRFLVRSKVAQLHPKDARKLRLVDFARDLDD